MPRSDTAQDTHNYDYRHIFIKLVLTPNSSTKSSEIESTFRDALFKTLQDLGGITQAIVHFDVISIENISANPNPIGGSDKVEIVCSMGVKLHKDDVKFVSATLPTYTSASPNDMITRMSLIRVEEVNTMTE